MKEIFIIKKLIKINENAAAEPIPAGQRGTSREESRFLKRGKTVTDVVKDFNPEAYRANVGHGLKFWSHATLEEALNSTKIPAAMLKNVSLNRKSNLLVIRKSKLSNVVPDRRRPAATTAQHVHVGNIQSSDTLHILLNISHG